MGHRLRIGVDIDGVVADFVTAFLGQARQVLGREIVGKHTTWDFEDSLSITKEEVKQVWDSIKETQNWFLHVPKAMPKVISYLQELALLHELYFITSRATTCGYTAQEQSQLFLNTLGIDFPTVLANFNKGDVAKVLKLDAFIDDYPANAELIYEKSPATKGFLMNATYNQDYNGPWTRVASFEEFTDKIAELAGE